MIVVNFYRKLLDEQEFDCRIKINPLIAVHVQKYTFKWSPVERAGLKYLIQAYVPTTIQNLQDRRGFPGLPMLHTNA